MKNIVLAGAIAVSLLAACSKDEDEWYSISVTDQAFMSRTALNNRAAILAGRLADSISTDTLVRAYAQQVMAQLTTAQMELLTIASNSAYVVGDSVDTVQKKFLTNLRALSGRAFDSVFLKGQVSDQQQSLSLFNTEMANGQQKFVKEYAGKYQPLIQNFYNKADSIYQLLF